MASGFGIFGIKSLKKTEIAEAFASLIVLALLSSGLYDFCRLIITTIVDGPQPTGKSSLYLCIAASVLFVAWFFYIYLKYRVYFGKNDENPGEGKGVVIPHKGIVLVLSKASIEGDEKKPEIAVKKINEAIIACSSDCPDPLYKIQGIGQLFKGLYHHRTILSHVWPIATSESLIFVSCLEVFLKKFIKKAVFVSNPKRPDGRYLIESTYQQAQIKETKDILKGIYEEEALGDMGLKRRDIIVDISGGPKHISIGLIFGGLDSDIDFQYTEQSNENNIIPLNIDNRIILDKTSDFLNEVYLQLNSAEFQKVETKP